MKSHLGQVAFKSSRTPRAASYDELAREYYDATFHPTCADFRAASRQYLARLFELEKPAGRFADVGCGISLVADFGAKDLVLVDKSIEMLHQNAAEFERRNLDIEKESFGEGEFDWIFAILGDPYNTQATWINIYRALKRGGNCVFIVPSFVWATKFRTAEKHERQNCALFITSRGEAVFLPSHIVTEAEQKLLVENAKLRFLTREHVTAGDMPQVRSIKISTVLKANEPVLDIYRVKKD